MTTVSGWTGREATLLRKALRLSVRDFAAHLGVGARTINKWEARQTEVTPLPYMQAVLDTALARAPDDAQARFAATTQTAVTEPGSASRSGSRTGGVLVPVVAEGQVVFVRVNPDDTGSGPGQLCGVTVGAPDAAVWKAASWVDRRDFGQHVAGLVLGIAGATGLDTGRLLALLPAADPTGTRHLGTADVEFIEQLTTTFVQQDFAHGSGLIRQAAVAQVHAVLPLLDAQVPTELRPRLMVAIAHLAAQTGWMSHDVQRDDAARRLWMIALDVARAAEHRLSADLTVTVLCRMASQALHLNRPEEALHLVRIAQSTADGPAPVSATTGTYVASSAAWTHAHRGDAAGCDRALGQAADRFSTPDTPSVIAPWVVSMDGSELAAHRGHAYYRLALTNRDTSVAARAVPLLRDFVDHLPSGHTRTRALNLADLTGAHALAGDTDTAVNLGHQAVDAVTAVSSPRAHERLRTLNTVLQPLHTSPGVAELRDRLAATGSLT